MTTNIPQYQYLYTRPGKKRSKHVTVVGKGAHKIKAFEVRTHSKQGQKKVRVLQIPLFTYPLL